MSWHHTLGDPHTCLHTKNINAKSGQYMLPNTKLSIRQSDSRQCHTIKLLTAEAQLSSMG